jgi:hypothetical protein
VLLVGLCSQLVGCIKISFLVFDQLYLRTIFSYTSKMSNIYVGSLMRSTSIFQLKWTQKGFTNIFFYHKNLITPLNLISFFDVESANTSATDIRYSSLGAATFKSLKFSQTLRCPFFLYWNQPILLSCLIILVYAQHTPWFYMLNSIELVSLIQILLRFSFILFFIRPLTNFQDYLILLLPT